MTAQKIAHRVAPFSFLRTGRSTTAVTCARSMPPRDAARRPYAANTALAAAAANQIAGCRGGDAPGQGVRDPVMPLDCDGDPVYESGKPGVLVVVAACDSMIQAA